MREISTEIKIEDRISILLDTISSRLSLNGDYANWSEENKIQLRILQAERLAYREYLEGTNLKTWLNESIVKEHYCGAQGIKNAIEFIENITQA